VRRARPVISKPVLPPSALVQPTDDDRHTREAIMTMVANIVAEQLDQLDPAVVRARRRLEAAKAMMAVA
jgi:hypothetical protein